MRTYKVRYLPKYHFIVVTATESGRHAEYGFSREVKGKVWKRVLESLNIELYA